MVSYVYICIYFSFFTSGFPFLQLHVRTAAPRGTACFAVSKSAVSLTVLVVNWLLNDIALFFMRMRETT